MFSRVIEFFKPPEYESLELNQKARFLNITLLVTSAVCLALAFQNLQEDETFIDILLFVLSGVSLLGIPLNKLGYYTPVAVFISVLVMVAITLSLIDGVGLKDGGLLAYPLYIIFTAFLFSKKATFISTLSSIASVLVVYFLQRMGYLKIRPFSIDIQVIVVCIFLIAAGFFLWSYMDNWERNLHNLRQTYDLTLNGWGKALEARDHETEGHSQRVVDLTLQLAKHLGLRDRQLNHIRRGALLHDIGKMAVPDSILLKKGSLSEEEWKVVKMHPITARNMLEGIPYLEPALDIPCHHHERWDGSGYPAGMSGEQIPLSARIFAVVDVWDALSSDRPYRLAWSRDKVRMYIEDHSGRLFDPRVVSSFLELVDEMG